MIYLYDNAIVEDLNKSFNPDNTDDPVVKVISPENVIGIAAAVKDDSLSFPIVALERREDTNIDSKLANFSRTMRGIPAVFDTDTNNIYYERSMPIDLSYTLTVMTTNQVDMDEIMRELLFKYKSMYFLSIHIPYEGDRDITFGMVIDNDGGITKQSGVSEYVDSGKLYQSSISIRCEGCVLLYYTPRHLKRNAIAVDVD